MGLALLLCAAPLAAQSCYVQLDDATALPLPPAQLAELEAAACELRAAFPVEFQGDFPLKNKPGGDEIGRRLAL